MVRVASTCFLGGQSYPRRTRFKNPELGADEVALDSTLLSHTPESDPIAVAAGIAPLDKIVHPGP